MKTRIELSIAAAALSIASFAAPAFAGDAPEDAHAFLQAERALTEGQSDGIHFAPKHAVGKRTPLDKWFASQRARTEGQSEAIRAGSTDFEAIRSTLHSWFEAQRARTEG